MLTMAAWTPPLGIRERELGARVIERHRSWGNLETSWLVKNTFAAWRSLQSQHPAGTTKDALIVELEQRLAEIMRGEPRLRRHAACLCADRALRTLARSCGAQHLLRWGLACFQHAAYAARARMELTVLQGHMHHYEERLRHSEARRQQVELRLRKTGMELHRSDAALRQSEDLLQQRLVESEAHLVASEALRRCNARGVAIAVCSAAASGEARGVLAWMLDSWRGYAARARRRRERSARLSSRSWSPTRVGQQDVQFLAATFSSWACIAAGSRSLAVDELVQPQLGPQLRHRQGGAAAAAAALTEVRVLDESKDMHYHRAQEKVPLSGRGLDDLLNQWERGLSCVAATCGSQFRGACDAELHGAPHAKPCVVSVSEVHSSIDSIRIGGYADSRSIATSPSGSGSLRDATDKAVGLTEDSVEWKTWRRCHPCLTGDVHQT